MKNRLLCIFTCITLLAAIQSAFAATVSFLISANQVEEEIVGSVYVNSPRTDEFDTVYVDSVLVLELPGDDLVLDTDDDTCVRVGINDIICSAITSEKPYTPGCKYCAEQFWDGIVDGVVLQHEEYTACIIAPWENGGGPPL